MPNLFAMSFEGTLAPSFDLRCLHPGREATRRLGHRLLPRRRAVGVGAQGAGAGERQHPQRAREGLGSPRLVHLRRAHPHRHLGSEQRRQHAALRAFPRRSRVAHRRIAAASASASWSAGASSPSGRRTRSSCSAICSSASREAGWRSIGDCDLERLRVGARRAERTRGPQPGDERRAGPARLRRRPRRWRPLPLRSSSRRTGARWPSATTS